MNRCFAILGLIWCCCATAAEVIPPKPGQYFNDYANVVSSATAQRLNQVLESFEQETSSQILVVVYPTMQSDSSIEDYTVRVYQSWHPGQKGKDNGAILFVFAKDHKMRIATGYGLEGALPDALCKQILDNEIAPHFKAGDYDAGLTAGVNAMLAATQGEYKGNGQTVAQLQHSDGSSTGGNWFVWLIIILVVLSISSRWRSSAFWGGWVLGSGGFGGGFSGGGGSTGGGGASGSW